MTRIFLWLTFSTISFFDLQGQILIEFDTDPIPKVRMGDAVFADLDKDGDNDIIISGEMDEDIGITRVFKNDGNGNFSLISGYSLPNLNFSSIAVGDIDSDGDLDAFMSGYISFYGEYSQLYVNNGNGQFSEKYGIMEDVWGGESVFFDSDNDGDLDLLFFGKLNLSAKTTKLYLNDGNGNFSDSGHEFLGFAHGSIDVGDVNGDGQLDLLLSGESSIAGSMSCLYLNQGSNNFQLSPLSFTPIYDGNAKFIDLELDGDLDIVANGVTNGMWIFRSEFFINNGVGDFVSTGNLGLDSLRSCSLAIADVNNDNYPDIFLSGRNSDDLDTCALYLNEEGSFIKQTDFIAQGLFNGEAIFSNIDNNCSPDLFYCGFGDHCLNESFLFLNQLNFEDNCIEEDEGDSEDDDLSRFQYSLLSNPIHDRIHVVCNYTINEVRLYDETGRLLVDSNHDNMEVIVNVQGFESGIYYLGLTTYELRKEYKVKVLKVD